MHYIRRGSERGHANHGWLDSHHTFSFAGYYDPEFMGYRSLRVINEDRVAAGAGFPKHPHRDMEIISYVLDGALEHKDTIGTSSVIRPGEVQLMSAGRGITHSEYNHSPEDGVHFFQIWIVPDRRGEEPGYQQRAYSDEERKGRWRLLVSPSGDDASLTIKQDARLYGTVLGDGETVSFPIEEGRGVWLQVARGSVKFGNEVLSGGDGLALEQVPSLEVTAAEPAELLLFDLA
ncbi:MAG: pirin family protein [Myxococcota bacterium]